MDPSYRAVAAVSPRPHSPWGSVAICQNTFTNIDTTSCRFHPYFLNCQTVSKETRPDAAAQRDDAGFYPVLQYCEERLLTLSCPSVRLPARNISAPTRWILMKFYISVFFFKSFKIIENSLKSDKNNGYFTLRPIYIFDNISLYSSQN